MQRLGKQKYTTRGRLQIDPTAKINSPGKARTFNLLMSYHYMDNSQTR